MPYLRPKDKYYDLARENNYRSRAAYKLLQINTKFNIFHSVSRSVDLCAAPGSWLEVVCRTVPSTQLKQAIGLDLEKIKPIPLATTAVCDINTPLAEEFLKNTLKRAKADLFLCDGAANVRGEYFSDSVAQNQLVVSTVLLSLKFLKCGGSLVTKFYRSEYYKKTLDILGKMFLSVESYKPNASRKESAETYIICKKMRRMSESTRNEIKEEISHLFSSPSESPSPSTTSVSDDKEINKEINEEKEKEGEKLKFENKFFNESISRNKIKDLLKNRNLNVNQVNLSDYLKGKIPFEKVLNSFKIIVDSEVELNNLLSEDGKGRKVNRTEVEYVCENTELWGRNEVNVILGLAKKYRSLHKPENNFDEVILKEEETEKEEIKKDEEEIKKEEVDEEKVYKKAKKVEKAIQKAEERKAEKWKSLLTSEKNEDGLRIEEFEKKIKSESSSPSPSLNSEPQTEIKEEIKEEKEAIKSEIKEEIKTKKEEKIEEESSEFSSEDLSHDSAYSEDEKKAAVLVLARKVIDSDSENLEMLEDAAFNRYTYPETDDSPEWLRRDERKCNNLKNVLSREEIDKEIQMLKRVKNRKTEKKENEAKARKAMTKMKKIKKLNDMIGNDNVQVSSKEIKGQIRNIVKKKERSKRYVVERPGGKRKNVGKEVKGKGKRIMVDRRMMKDKKREIVKKRTGVSGVRDKKLKRFKSRR